MPAEFRRGCPGFRPPVRADRYVDDGALLGTVPKALRTARTFEAVGVDETACLIDFGLPTGNVGDRRLPMAPTSVVCSARAGRGAGALLGIDVPDADTRMSNR